MRTALWFVWLIPSAVLAQAPDAREVLKQVDAALRKGATYRMTAVWQNASDPKAAPVTYRVASRRVRSDAGNALPLARIETQGGKIVIFPSAYRSLLVAHDEKTCLSIEGLGVLNQITDTWSQFGAERCFQDEVEAPSVVHLGFEAVDGHACHQIRVNYTRTAAAEWWISRNDLLPRRVKRLGDMSTQTTFSGIETEPELAADTFLPAIPKGYACKPLPGGASLKLAGQLVGVGFTEPEKLIALLDEPGIRENLDMIEAWLNRAADVLRPAALEAAASADDYRKRITRIGGANDVPADVINRACADAPGSEIPLFLVLVDETTVVVRNRVQKKDQPFAGTFLLPRLIEQRRIALHMLEGQRQVDPGFVAFMKATLDGATPMLREGVAQMFTNIASAPITPSQPR